MKDVPNVLLTPTVVLVGMVGNLAADAAYVVLIPLAGIIFHAAGRHPIAGIAAASPVSPADSPQIYCRVS